MSDLPSQILIAIFQLIISIFEFVFMIFSWYWALRSQRPVIKSKDDESPIELSHRAVAVCDPIHGDQGTNPSSSALPIPTDRVEHPLPHPLHDGSGRPSRVEGRNSLGDPTSDSFAVIDS
ncbi:hypothetical protein F5Y12DRAFT_713604 [Xylaria sp. FL1777]|nr:hypothetical protein F5Y12DRAFT_713604 [Xylaria sp. FL1777]